MTSVPLLLLDVQAVASEAIKMNEILMLYKPNLMYNDRIINLLILG